MDALNLAIVICPNLVKGSNPARDMAMVFVPGTPAFFDRPSSNDGNGKNPQEKPATLGMIIALCIRRYYEVFDEIMDPSEAVPSRHVPFNGSPYSSVSSSALESPEQPMYVLSNEEEEEEDLDDDKLATPVQNRWPPNALAAASPTDHNYPSSSTAPPPKRHKNIVPSGSSSGISSATRSTHTLIGETSGSIGTGGSHGYIPHPTYSKAKSAISIENDRASGNGGKGSVTIGRGTTRKSSGAGVEAIGVTAEGFFSAPTDAPLVPDGKGGWMKS